METIVGLVAGRLGVSLVPPSLARAGRGGVSFRAPVGRGSPINYDLALAFIRRSPMVDAFIASVPSSLM